MNKIPQHVQDEIRSHVGQIAALFKNPRITLLVRTPGLKDGDLLLTDDDIKEAVKAIEYTSSKASSKIK